MICRNGVVLFSLFIACLTANAPAATTVAIRTPTDPNGTRQVPGTTSAPFALRQDDLQRRGEKDDTICGAAPKATNWLDACGGHARCTHTFIKQQHSYNAYQYCSPPLSATNQATIYTTGASNWGTNESCPSSTYCCAGHLSLMQTNYFVKSGYTVTGFDCTNAPPLIATYIAQKNLLDPSKFSAEMSILNEPQPFLSPGAKIGVGVGVGVGVAVLLIVGMLFWMRWRKAQRSRVEFSEASVQDTAELAGKDDSYELCSTGQLSSELPSKERAHELPTQQPQELATDWEPSQVRSASK